ncbi:MAG: transposase [Candidatus Omnitrophota bacterium]|nr:transposase [Candidatus Omnitrophota bacterium]
MPYTARSYSITGSLIYHIFNRGNAKNNIFHDNEDYNRFIEILTKYTRQRNLRIHHWVIMSNHYHLLLALDNPKEISSIMAGIARSYVYYYHKKYNSVGHLFQGRFKCQAVEKEEYLLTCGRYIERNPINAGLVQSAAEYPFSSAAYYIYGKVDSLTEENPLFATFGLTAEGRRLKYQSFLLEFDEKEEELFDDFEKPLGSGEFLRRLVLERGVFMPRNGRPRREIVNR